MKGDNIAALRKRKGIKQEELAHLLSITPVTLSRWENGHFEPKASVIKKLCEILCCTENELLNGPTGKQTRLVVTYDWSKYEEGGIAMDDNGFELILGSQGQIGLKGAGKLTSREAMEEFLARVRLQVETAFEAQVKRGAIQLA